MTLDFSTVNLGNNEIMPSKLLRESDVLPRILYPTKITIQSMSRIKPFSEIQDLKKKKKKISTILSAEAPGEQKILTNLKT